MDDTSPRWRIRPATAADRAFLDRLAPRLAIGIPPWRDPAAMLATARRWFAGDLERMGADAMVFIAEAASGTPVGAAATRGGFQTLATEVG